MAVNRTTIQNVTRKPQDGVPKRTRAQNAAAGIIVDLPIKAAEGSLEPRIGEGTIKDRLAFCVESDPGRNLPDVGIEFRFRTPLDMAFEKPDNPKARHQQRQRNRYGAEEKEAEFKGSRIHGFIDSMM